MRLELLRLELLDKNYVFCAIAYKMIYKVFWISNHWCNVFDNVKIHFVYIGNKMILFALFALQLLAECFVAS